MVKVRPRAQAAKARTCERKRGLVSYEERGRGNGVLRKC